jgi:hypothetical protein
LICDAAFYFSIRVKILKNVEEMKKITDEKNSMNIALCVQNEQLSNQLSGCLVRWGFSVQRISTRVQLMQLLESQKRSKSGPSKIDLLIVDQSFLVAEVEDNNIINPDNFKLSHASYFKIKVIIFVIYP